MAISLSGGLEEVGDFALTDDGFGTEGEALLWTPADRALVCRDGTELGVSELLILLEAM